MVVGGTGFVVVGDDVVVVGGVVVVVVVVDVVVVSIKSGHTMTTSLHHPTRFSLGQRTLVERLRVRTVSTHLM